VVASTRLSSTLGIARSALGVGLRAPHFAYIVEHWPQIDFFEIISENFLDPETSNSQYLAQIAARYPIAMHGVTLNLLGHEPLDEHYLDSLCRLADRIDAPYITDHLCWTGSHGITYHDLLPVPYTEELVEVAAERAAYVQRRLGRPFGLENLSSAVELTDSTMTEWEFYARVVRTAGCWHMLDINNVYVSSVNHRFDPHAYLAHIDLDRVVQVHVAGHSPETNGIILDTHDRPVRDEVWQLYAATWKRGGPFPTLVEWDAEIPELPVVLAEADRARSARA
jgi:uncharacterized protein